MRDRNSVQVPKWPFFLGDAAMLGIGYFIYYQTAGRLGHWEMVACTICVALGAGLAILPFVLDHRARVKQLDAVTLLSVTERIRNLETLTNQISTATNEWQNVQVQAEKISGSAKEVTERMAAEVREFSEFMQKAGDGEKATLRLEVEKLRRSEREWIQIVMHLLDHVNALHAGAVRSGQSRVIEQITQFRSACLDVARRIGLVAFAPSPGDAFDAQRHRHVEGGEANPSGGSVDEVAAAGFTFQGQLVRPALVRTAKESTVEPQPTAQLSSSEPGQLTLESSPSK